MKGKCGKDVRTAEGRTEKSVSGGVGGTSRSRSWKSRHADLYLFRTA